MNLPRWRTHRSKSPGSPQRVFAAPSPCTQYSCSRSVAPASPGLVSAKPGTVPVLGDVGQRRPASDQPAAIGSGLIYLALADLLNQIVSSPATKTPCGHDRPDGIWHVDTSRWTCQFS